MDILSWWQYIVPQWESGLVKEGHVRQHQTLSDAVTTNYSSSSHRPLKGTDRCTAKYVARRCRFYNKSRKCRPWTLRLHLCPRFHIFFSAQASSEASNNSTVILILRWRITSATRVSNNFSLVSGGNSRRSWLEIEPKRCIASVSVSQITKMKQPRKIHLQPRVADDFGRNWSETLRAKAEETDFGFISSVCR